VKTLLFIGALATAALAISGKIRMNYGLLAAGGMIVIANLISDTTTA
jgi:hypothetical protein